MTPFTPEPKTTWTIARPYLFVAAGVAIFIALWVQATANYLLFHVLAEMFTVAVSFSIFIITYNTRRFLRNNYLLVLGMALLFVGIVDLLHALAYQGMGVFPGEDIDRPTQLWLVGRFIQAGALLAAPAMLTRPTVKARFVLPILATLTAALLVSIFMWPIMPAAFDQNGLTNFKIASEYVVCVALLGALVLLGLRRRYFEPRVVAMLGGYLLLTIFSELAFTLYTQPNGAANLAGHLIRILAVYLAYKAIVQTGLVEPYALLFRELKLSEERHRAGEERFERIANVFQEALLSVPETLPGVEYGHLYQSATQATKVGGDFYDLFELDGDWVAVVVGDVSGKGLPAATLTSRVKNTIRAYSMTGNSPAETLTRTNSLLLRFLDNTSWVSVFLGYLHAPTGRLLYCSAGHPPSIVHRRNGSGDDGDGETFFLETISPILAAFEEAKFVDSEEILAADDILLLYTDGVIEARQDGELFGDERLLEFVAYFGAQGAPLLPELLFAELQEFASGRLADDIAIVAIARQDDGAKPYRALSPSG